MVNWEQVINEMELPELRESTPVGINIQFDLEPFVELQRRIVPERFKAAMDHLAEEMMQRAKQMRPCMDNDIL